MPRDSSGNYTLPAGNPVVDGTIIEAPWANSTLSDIALQLNNVLTRDGLLGPTGPVLFVDGTLSAPGIAWSSEPGMGWYRAAANTTAFAIAGAEKARFGPNNARFLSGILSLGPAPAAWGSGISGLQLYGGSVYSINNGSAGYAQNLYFNGTDLAYLNSGNPAAAFLMSAANHLWFTAPTGNAGDVATLTQRMKIDPEGRVYINRTDDSAGVHRLLVRSSANTADAAVFSSPQGAGSNSQCAVLIESGDTYASFGVQGSARNALPVAFIYTENNIGIAFSTNDLERMRIAAGGFVGIATNDPTYRLHVRDGGPAGVAANSNYDGIVLESNANTGVSILVPNGSIGQFVVGTAADHLRAQFGVRSTGVPVISSGGTQDFHVRHGDAAADYPIGFRNVPTTVTGGGTAGAEMRGKCYVANGNITIPANVFSAGDVLTIFNNTAGNISILRGSGMSLWLAGAGTGSDNTRMLATIGLATVFFISATSAVVSGSGVT